MIGVFNQRRTAAPRCGPLVASLLLVLGGSAPVVRAQGVPLAPGTTLFDLDPSATPVGDFPSSLKLLKGLMEVAVYNGTPMLKASSVSEFLITLPQVLPRDFTLEFDLIPKDGYNPQDLSFEGTATINQGSGSAHVLWQATGELIVIGGGGDTYDTPMPDDLRATLPGVLTHVVAELQGPTLRLYTNGRRMYTLTKQFARGRVLRVLLGGLDDGPNAVYLARLRISSGSGLGIVAAQAGLPNRSTSAVPSSGVTSPPPAPPPPPPAPPPPPPPPAPATPPPPPPPPSPSGTPTGPTLTIAYVYTSFGFGVLLIWDPVPNATSYRIYRTSSPGRPATLIENVTSAEAAKYGGGVGTGLGVLDPDGIDLVASSPPTYWVEAEFSNGGVSAPGPIATPTVAQGPVVVLPPSISIPNVRVSAFAPKTINGQPVPGVVDLTWTWDQSLPPLTPAFVYYVTLDLLSAPGVFTRLRDDKLLSPFQAPIHVVTTATVLAPPFTESVHSGSVVKLCVAPLDIRNLSVATFPSSASCLLTPVP